VIHVVIMTDSYFGVTGSVVPVILVHYENHYPKTGSVRVFTLRSLLIVFKWALPCNNRARLLGSRHRAERLGSHNRAERLGSHKRAKA
jgi:hypothetical protein